ncbi:MAG: helix-turn-helix domain-containing protein, partial [Lachnospiraceae bacterium]|nr:helix-turn-helix domain-containing protein [Lachnospiraceae bacterium]
MSKYIPGNQKHLTLEDREYIKKSLDKGMSFKDIAKFLCKDPTTISKEVKNHRLDEWFRRGPFYNKQNFCEKRFRC